MIEDYWYEQFDGYLRNGIEEGSDKHQEAKKILMEAKLGENCLVKNNFTKKYIKIAVVNKNMLSKLTVTDASGKRLISAGEKSALEKVYDLYDENKMSKEEFIKEIEKYPNLKKLREWWNTLKEKSIQITSVGKVLAHSNAQRIDRSLPPLD